MQATTVELLGLFDRDIRYLVPIFQRNYKWNRDEHWAPLLEDIVAVAEDLLEFGEGAEIPDHFLGAIVCEQLPVFGRDAHAVSVIDGQQRLTTLQLLLAAMRRVAAARGYDDAAYLEPLVENRDAVVRERPSQRFKVWPNVADRDAYVSAMLDASGDSEPVKAVRFFEAGISRWLDVGREDDPLDDEDNTPAERMAALVTAITRHLKIVKIDLEDSDNAQVIFETLNARGERLSDSDLIRNYLFRTAEAQGHAAEKLHELYWRQFDDKRWSRNIAHGRHQRDRLHLFLNHWLSMTRVKEVPAGTVFREFKELVGRSGSSVEPIAADIAQYAEVFDSLDSFEADSPEWWFFRRLAEMDLITVYPPLLWLFGHAEAALPRSSRTRAIRAIESFLVRRLLQRNSTRSYGNVFIDVLKAAADGPPDSADQRVIRALESGSSEADRWPTDDEMRTAILNVNVYKLKQSRLRMVLEAIERASVTASLTERLDLGAALWIEHLLPQTWRGVPAWGLQPDLVDPTQAALERDHILHTLGNLTLTTSALDISLSNKPWEEKLGALAKHSSLALNRELLERYPSVWNEETIRSRGLLLAERFIAIWPGPQTMLGELDS